MLSSSKDTSLKIWDLREGRLLFSLQGHSGPVNCARFSKDGSFFASGGADQLVMLWKSNLYAAEEVGAAEAAAEGSSKPRSARVSSSSESLAANRRTTERPASAPAMTVTPQR